MKKNNTKKNDDKIQVLEGISISQINNYSDSVTFFTLHLNTALGDMLIPSCKILSGKKGDFIALPSTKGSDNKYYPFAYCSVSKEISEAIIDAIANNI